MHLKLWTTCALYGKNVIIIDLVPISSIYLKNIQNVYIQYVYYHMTDCDRQVCNSREITALFDCNNFTTRPIIG